MPAKTTNASAAAKSGLKFETPPAAERSNANADQYAAEAAELRANPGAWAVLKEFTGEGSGARSGAWRLASRVKKGEIKAFAPAGSFEAVTRSNGHSKVYVRFVGEAAEQAADAEGTDQAAEGDSK
jgi:hypothetical protein